MTDKVWHNCIDRHAATLNGYLVEPHSRPHIGQNTGKGSATETLCEYGECKVGSHCELGNKCDDNALPPRERSGKLDFNCVDPEVWTAQADGVR